jgi:bifunctional ADP-heptose synthase (sugar kinase/adenylyltransferase)
MNTEELRLPLGDKYSPIEKVAVQFSLRTNFQKFLVTLSKEGCLYFQNGKILKAPAFVKETVDTVGAGDAVFAITSLLIHKYKKEPQDIIPFIANCVGGVAVRIMGNKEPVTKKKLFKFIEGVYKNGME